MQKYANRVERRKWKREWHEENTEEMAEMPKKNRMELGREIEGR